MEIRIFKKEDFPSVRRIYQEGIDTGNATFEKQAPSWKDWDNNFLPFSRIVATLEKRIVGWAALTAVSGRCVYTGVCEISVYVDPQFSGKGIGSALLNKLITVSEKNNIWTLQAGIFPENKASIKIHENLGFRQVGIREKIGEMNGRWRDVLLMERRSKVIY